MGITREARESITGMASSAQDGVGESGYVTPRREEFHIPERRVPPPPPRKRPLLLPRGGRRMETLLAGNGYFKPPDDLEAIFAAAELPRDAGLAEVIFLGKK